MILCLCISTSIFCIGEFYSTRDRWFISRTSTYHKEAPPELYIAAELVVLLSLVYSFSESGCPKYSVSPFLLLLLVLSSSRNTRCHLCCLFVCLYGCLCLFCSFIFNDTVELPSLHICMPILLIFLLV